MQVVAFQSFPIPQCLARRSLYGSSGIAVILVVACLLLLPGSAGAQLELLEEDWLTLESEHFILISKESARSSERLLADFEQWRAAIASFVPATDLPVASVPNYLYVFDSEEDLARFIYTQDNAYFAATPRANFMALVGQDDQSIALARHHYAHFLIRNFSDLRVPRWYEEGLATFLSRVEIGRTTIDFDQYSARNNGAMVSISEAFSMQRLLFRDQALASPRILQIANLKAESLYYYLNYGFQLDGFPDRRQSLRDYLNYLFDDRNPRFAYDLSFDVTPAQLDDELVRFLEQSQRPRIEIDAQPVAVQLGQARELEADTVSILLGEMALNGGQPLTAQIFFEHSISLAEPAARAYSGLGDVLRFQELTGRDQEIARYFQIALDIAPDDVNIVLDYGEYWEAELIDCAKTYPPARRQYLADEIERNFNYALQLAPANPEVHLALGQLALLPERDWQAGQEHQRRAFDLLPGDSFILEQAARYAIEAAQYERAEMLITEMAQPLHSFGEPGYVSDLRARLHSHRRDEDYDRCVRATR